MRFRSLPIVWQTLATLIGGLAVAQAVFLLLILVLPPPRPDFHTLTELADALSGNAGPETDLRLARGAVPPTAQDGMISQPALTARLARTLGRAPIDVRLFFGADQAAMFPFSRTGGQGAVPVRHGQPYFFNTVTAAVRRPDGSWSTVRAPPPPLISSWQRRTALWFALSALAMLPLAWVFARALTRPIRRLAAAVGRLDHDDAPPVPIEGPVELRLTAIAINDMRRNLHAYLRERTAMIGAIAHDLRTPLARIAFRIEHAPDTLRVPVQGDIEQMRAMIATTIGFVRDAAGGGGAVRQPVDLAALARRLADQAAETGSAVTVAALEPATVLGDRAALERLVQNLIDNAVAYAGAAELVLARDGGSARLGVRDRGPGIPAAELERMFEPFARAEPSRSRSTGGIGLGLAIARSIARAQGGGITAENRMGGGLAVTVTLPLAGG